MKKRLVVLLCVTSMCVGTLAGCGEVNVNVNATSAADEEVVQEETETEEAAEDVISDQEAADNVAALIDAIYVQQRNDNTDEQCAAAKAAWDALTDAQKELVEGEEADPDYFGRDTGDASLDNPLNQDEIGDNEILVASFGTSFNDTRAMDIGGIESKLQEEFPDWAVRRAFTAQIIINHVQARDDEHIDNMDQALERAVNNGVKNLIVQPTHLMHGAEYDELSEAVNAYADKFETIAIAEPLLGEVGQTEEEVNADKEIVAKAITLEAVKEAGYSDIEEAVSDSTAFVFMGHGTSHKAKITYSQMASQMKNLGYENVFIGTVEGEPEETECGNVIEAVKEAGFSKVILRPLMVVAGDHANNDMAGDEDDSWKSMFNESGAFDSVECQIAGLGRIADVQDVYVEHTRNAIEAASAVANEDKADTTELADGVYEAKFDTDSGMFHVNEALDGKGTLTVKDGEMMIHITLAGTGILNLYEGLAADAESAADDELLQPTVDEVTYDDGTTEEVYGFDVKVPAIGEEFDLALIGKKGVWYDHKVSVSEPVAQ